jgi:hypothetical protein
MAAWLLEALPLSAVFTLDTLRLWGPLHYAAFLNDLPTVNTLLAAAGKQGLGSGGGTPTRADVSLGDDDDNDDDDDDDDDGGDDDGNNVDSGGRGTGARVPVQHSGEPLGHLVNQRTGASQSSPLMLTSCPKVATALIATGAVDWAGTNAQGNTALHAAARLCVAFPDMFTVIVEALQVQVRVCVPGRACTYGCPCAAP